MAPQDRRSKRGRGDGGREVTVSKALSWLLRHGAVKEGVTMDAQGYVACDELLRWHKLKALGLGMEELVRVVEGNEKGRFALSFVGGGGGDVVGEEATNTSTISDQLGSMSDGQQDHVETETQRALQHAATGDLEPSRYLIRATQGHSLKTIEASAYLTPITLQDPKGLPETVVHGTFYGAWERILASGGLKSMGRVHVHFATGPRVEDVLDRGKKDGGGPGGGKKTDVVISGMRADAQILIYVDIRRALEAGVEFWKSENGVVLTEGVAIEGGKMLASEFWDVVVEIKAGVGVLWKQGEGVVRDLPAELKGTGMPRGKERVGRGGGGRGRGNAKPKLRVERDDGEVVG
jgi:2'-phosphotransferase